MSSPSPTPSYKLTSAQKAHFLEYGFIKIPSCFTREQAAEKTSNLWTRLGFSPTDQGTWLVERTNMPLHSHFSVSEFAPKAWDVMCELLGGEERISESMRSWSDGFIVNLGKEEYNPTSDLDLRAQTGWHNDGDFFVHFLDSPEQALLVIPLWSDIVPKGGGTIICCDGIKHIAKHLYDHPEGVTPWMKSLHDPSHDKSEGTSFWQDLASDPTKTRDQSFFEITGEVGDVVFLHPLMLHSAAKNLLRRIRVITNPPVALKEPFCFQREDEREYSLVEVKTLRELGMRGGIGEWRVRGERKVWVPGRVGRMEEMRRREVERLAGREG